VDTVSVGSEVLRCFKDDVKAAPLEGVYVHGLVIENAAWDARNARITDNRRQVGRLYTHITAGPRAPVLLRRCILWKYRSYRETGRVETFCAPTPQSCY